MGLVLSIADADVGGIRNSKRREIEGHRGWRTSRGQYRTGDELLLVARRSGSMAGRRVQRGDAERCHSAVMIRGTATNGGRSQK